MNSSHETVLDAAKHYAHVSYINSCTLQVLVKFLKRVKYAKQNTSRTDYSQRYYELSCIPLPHGASEWGGGP